MFDATGIIEIYCTRIATDPLQDEYGHSYPSESSTHDRFVVFAFLMERFDWMGEDIASISFSLDNRPTEAAEYVLRPGCNDRAPMLSPKPRAVDEMQFYDSCYEGHRRLDLSSATLQPVNSYGSPLSTQEHGISRLVITLRRVRRGIARHSITGEPHYHFVPAPGAAGFPTHVVFHYDSPSRGAVHMTKTMTTTQCTLPRLELTRTSLTHTSLQPVTRKRAREVQGESSSRRSDIDSSPPTKHPKLTDSDDSELMPQGGDEFNAAYHGPLSPYWSEAVDQDNDEDEIV